MARRLLLDAFCCAGGAGTGYRRAEFDVVGVDIQPQPRYPFEFHQGDAVEFILEHGHEFDVIHASPPCQTFTAYRRRGNGVGDGYVNLIPQTRDALMAAGCPFVIENVETARAELVDPVMLCGSSFGLDVRRHRLFETSWAAAGKPCRHGWQSPRFAPASNRTNLRCTVEVGVYRIPLAVQQAAMGIGWMKLRELSQAIPPAYTRYIGDQLMSHLEERAA